MYGWVSHNFNLTKGAGYKRLCVLHCGYTADEYGTHSIFWQLVCTEASKVKAKCTCNIKAKTTIAP